MPIYQFFTFKQQIPKFSQDSLPYSIIFPNHWKLMVYCWKLWEKCNSHEKQYCYFLGVKSLPWNDMYYKIIQTLNSKKQLKKGSTLIGNWSINNNVALWSFLCQNWFFKLEPFLVCFTCLILSSQNFIIFLKKQAIFLQILKYSQLCLMFLNISRSGYTSCNLLSVQLLYFLEPVVNKIDKKP